MRKRQSPDERLERTHWEGLVRTMIDIIGVERFNEITAYVVNEMIAERQRLRDFAVECRRIEH